MVGTLREGVRKPGTVDAAWYAARHPEAARSGVHPLVHYAAVGQLKGYAANAAMTESAAPGTHKAEEAWALALRSPFWDAHVGRASPADWSRELAQATLWAKPDPEVSIVVLNFNRSAMTQACLAAIFRNTTGHRYEVIVVDNGSLPDEFAILASTPGPFRLVRLPVNRYFGEGNNIGVDEARAPIVVLLNNDAFVLDGWLEPLVTTLNQRDDAGAAGATLRYPDGRLQEAGASVQPDGTVIQHGKQPAPRRDAREKAVPMGKSAPLAGARADRTALPVDYCSAAALAVRRDAFRAVAGFDFLWEPAYYEDVDLAFKLRALGLRTYHCPSSEVVHIESATTSDQTRAPGMVHLVDLNRPKFVQRWSPVLHDRQAPWPQPWPKPAVEPSEGARLPATTAKRPLAVLYTPYALVPGGGERYLLTVANALAQTHRVVVATPARYSSLRLVQIAHALGLDASGITLSTWDEALRMGAIDRFVALGNEALPSVSAAGRHSTYICQFPFPMSASQIQAHWQNLAGFHEVVVYSNFVAQHLEARLASVGQVARIKVVYPPVPQLGPAGKGPASPLRLLTIGRIFRGGHDKRHDAMIDALRRLVDAGLDVHLDIVGSRHSSPEHLEHAAALQRSAVGLPCTFHMDAPLSQVATLAGAAHVYWHAAGLDVPDTAPERCEHFGISILEAMSAGAVPVVVNAGAAPEFIESGQNGFLYRDLDGLADATRGLARDEGLRNRLGKAAQATAARFDVNRFRNDWAEATQDD